MAGEIFIKLVPLLPLGDNTSCWGERQVRKEGKRSKEKKDKSKNKTNLELHLTERLTGSPDTPGRHRTHHGAHGSLQLAGCLVEGECSANLEIVKLYKPWEDNTRSLYVWMKYNPNSSQAETDRQGG